MAAITCPKCNHSREVEPAKVPHAKVRVRCPSCKEQFELDGTAFHGAEPELELDWKDREDRTAPAADAPPPAPEPVASPPEPAFEASPSPLPPALRHVPGWVWWRVLPALLLLLGLNQCFVRGCDRPAALGLRWRTEGVSLSRSSRVLVFLHGAGGSGARSEWFAEAVIEQARGANATIVLPDGPLAYWFGRYWFSSLPAHRADSLKRILELIDEISTKYGIPRERVLVGGFSAGGGLALDVAAQRPAPVGGAVLLSGTYLRDTLAPEVPLFFAHGRKDSLVPFDEAEAIALRFKKEGTPVTFLPFDDDHFLTKEVQAAVAEILVNGMDRPKPE